MFFYQNAGGFRTKLREFQQAVSCSFYDILAFSETWLNSQITNDELGLSNFDIFRVDRDTTGSEKKRGGGVIIITKKHLKARKLDVPLLDIEQVFVSVKLDKDNVILGCLYIPPQSPVEVYHRHCDSVECILEKYPNSKLVIVGDFNLPDAVWGRDELGLTVQCPETSNACIVANCYSFFNLCQLNPVLNSRNVALDLVFSNLLDISVSCASDVIFQNTMHHSAIFFELSLSCQKTQYEEFFYDFKNANYLAINDYLAGIEWTVLFANKNINEICLIFYEILFYIIDLYVPLKRFKTSTFPRWFDANLRRLTVEKKVAHTNFKRYGTMEYYQTFSVLREQCKEYRQVCYRRYLNRVENNINDDPRRFWSYVRDHKNDYSIPVSLTYSNQTSNSLEDSVNLFAAFFQSVYVWDDSVNIPEFKFDTSVDINNYSTNLVEIYESICDLPARTSCGPDGIPALFLKHCVNTLVVPLNIIYNLSLSTETFPEIWKSCFLKPIFKSGERNLVENYRAVCIQSDMPKILDHLVSQKLAWDFRHIINPEQHGFVRGRSTATNLMLYQHFIINSLESHRQVDSVYTDFSKAFDRVNHDILLTKLAALGVGGAALGWIRSYISGRTQYVRCGGSTSEAILVPSGVPQGSHCGPMLFDIFVLDLVDSVINSSLLMFADDVKIYRSVTSVSDSLLLQDDISNFHLWCCMNRMDLNVRKCNIMTFTRSPAPMIFDYVLNGVILERQDEIRDLGITLDSKLSFTTHILNITIKASKVLGFVQRLSAELSLNTFRILYCALVRPILEYCSVIWSPNYRVHIDAIERIQRRFLRVSAFKMGLVREQYSYNDILSALRLKSLESRRFIIDMIFLHNVLSGHIDCSDILSLINFNAVERRGRYTDCFRVQFHHTTYGCNESLTRLLVQANGIVLNNGQICFFDSRVSTFKRLLNVVI